jgi:hypothetical protein
MSSSFKLTSPRQQNEGSPRDYSGYRCDDSIEDNVTRNLISHHQSHELVRCPPPANLGPNLWCSLPPRCQTSGRVGEGPMIVLPLPLLRPQQERRQDSRIPQACWLLCLSPSTQTSLPTPTTRHQQCAFAEQAIVRYRPSRRKPRKAQHHALPAPRHPPELRIQHSPKRSLYHHPEYSPAPIQAQLPDHPVCSPA